jgi:hypothetical protein
MPSGWAVGGPVPRSCQNRKPMGHNRRGTGQWATKVRFQERLRLGCGGVGESGRELVGWFGREKVVGVGSDDSKCMG